MISRSTEINKKLSAQHKILIRIQFHSKQNMSDHVRRFQNLT